MFLVLQIKLYTIDLYDFVLRGSLTAKQFADGDTILVKRRGPTIEVRGKVATAATVEFDKPTMTGADALAIVPKAAVATAVTISGVRGNERFHRTMTVSAFRRQKLAPGDSIEFRDDGLAGTILIELKGEFRGPSILSVKRGARLLDVLNYVKVDPALSNVSAIHMRRDSVAKAQKRSIEDSLFRLERSALLAMSATEREAGIRVREAQLMQSFVKSARLIQPLGRIVTSSAGQQLNVLLQDGDVVVIPPKTNVIRIGGEIQMAQAVMYRPGLKVRDYVKLAGGYTKRSDRGRVIIIRPSAAVRVATIGARVGPGDEILIPPKVDSKLLQNAADITQVIYQIAVAAAVVLAI